MAVVSNCTSFYIAISMLVSLSLETGGIACIRPKESFPTVISDLDFADSGAVSEGND